MDEDKTSRTAEIISSMLAISAFTIPVAVFLGVATRLFLWLAGFRESLL